MAQFLGMVSLVACAASPDAIQPALAGPPDRFPDSMKGYVLYGWERSGQMWFTLVTGTNRAKTFEELNDPVTRNGDDGFVRVRVQGLAAARELLRRVPHGEALLLDLDHVSVARSTLPEDVTFLDMTSLATDLED